MDQRNERRRVGLDKEKGMAMSGKLDPNRALESVYVIQSEIWGYSGVAERSEEGGAVSVLFHRSVVGVVRQGRVVPPDLFTRL